MNRSSLLYRKLAQFFGAAVALSLLVAPGASAGSVSGFVFGSQSQLSFNAAAGETNNLTISRTGTSTYSVTDSVPITLGAGQTACTASGTTATCTCRASFSPARASGT